MAFICLIRKCGGRAGAQDAWIVSPCPSCPGQTFQRSAAAICAVRGWAGPGSLQAPSSSFTEFGEGLACSPGPKVPFLQRVFVRAFPDGRLGRVVLVEAPPPTQESDSAPASPRDTQGCCPSTSGLRVPRPSLGSVRLALLGLFPPSLLSAPVPVSPALPNLQLHLRHGRKPEMRSARSSVQTGAFEQELQGSPGVMLFVVFHFLPGPELGCWATVIGERCHQSGVMSPKPSDSQVRGGS